MDDTIALWTAEPSADRPLLALLHGYGSDERDLFSLARFLPEEYVCVAVRAPEQPHWPMPGFSWYPINDLESRDATAITTSAQNFLGWFSDQPASSRGILGFSQGAAIATQALRLASEEISFVVNLAGYAAPGNLPGDAALKEKRPPVFWGRGSHDDVIPPHLVEHTTSWLPQHATLSGRIYPGLTHSISQDELDDVVTFLDKQLRASAP